MPTSLPSPNAWRGWTTAASFYPVRDRVLSGKIGIIPRLPGWPWPIAVVRGDYNAHPALRVRIPAPISNSVGEAQRQCSEGTQQDRSFHKQAVTLLVQQLNSPMAALLRVLHWLRIPRGGDSVKHLVELSRCEAMIFDRIRVDRDTGSWSEPTFIAVHEKSQISMYKQSQA